MSWFVLIFIAPLCWYIGVRMGYRTGVKNTRRAVLREIVEARKKMQQ